MLTLHHKLKLFVKGIVVKVINKKLGEQFYKKKGVVEASMDWLWIEMDVLLCYILTGPGGQVYWNSEYAGHRSQAENWPGPPGDCHTSYR